MKLRHILLALALTLGMGQTAVAMDQGPEQLARDVVTYSGIADAIQHIPYALKGAVTQQLRRSGASDEEIGKLSRRIETSFSANELTKLLEEHVLTLMSEQDMQQVMTWLRSPLGRKIVEAEIQAGTEQGNTLMSQQIGQLMQQYQGSPRERLFRDYDRATHATEALVEGTLSLQLAMIAATLTSREAGAGSPVFNEVRREMESRRGVLHNMLGQEAYASYLFIYRDLSLEELSTYIDFASSDVGSRYVQVLIDGVWEVITARTEYFERYVADVTRPGA